MGRAPCCSKVGLHRGPWTSKEDALLAKYIQAHGEGQWRSLPKRAGLLRCGKSCRLRWMNYLRPDIKRGNITPEEDDLIIRMHSLLGNRWSLIAGRLPGRTDNEIKNYWNTHLSKRLRKQGTDPNTHTKLSSDQEITAKRSNTKKKKKQQTKNQKMGSRENLVEEKEKTIYLPKPIRVSALTIQRTDSRTFTLDSNSASGSSSQDKEEESQEDQKEVNLAWAENDGFGFFIEDHDLVNGSQDHMECHGTLEKLYEEYFQLLKSDENVQEELDSFAQSLLI